MDKVHIPHSSVAISRLGFGCARIFGGSELRGSTVLIEEAIRCGIRHFDTAPAYGSEDVLGSVLADVRDATIATKVGLPRFNGKQPAARRFFGPLYRGTLRPILARTPGLKSRLLRLAAKPTLANAPLPKRRLHRDEVLRELDDSLRRLRRPAIDLYLLHEPEFIEITDELHEVFLSLKSSGLIGAFGLAFGALPSGSGSFGTVVQCRFPGISPPLRRDSLQIFHGVVRFGVQSIGEDGMRGTAGKLIARTLHGHRASSVIFSASTSHQINEISRSCGVGA